MKISFLILLLAFCTALLLQAEKSYERMELLTIGATTHSRDKQWKPGEGITMEVSGMTWVKDVLFVAIRKGEIWRIENPHVADRKDLSMSLFASGLHEPLGLLADGNDILVTQRSEVTRLRDRNGDGRADAYLTEGDGWNVSGNYHAYAYTSLCCRRGKTRGRPWLVVAR